MKLNKDHALTQATIAFLMRSLLCEELAGVKEIVLSVEITQEPEGIAANVTLRVDGQESSLIGAGGSPLEAIADAADMFAGDINGPAEGGQW